MLFIIFLVLFLAINFWVDQCIEEAKAAVLEPRQLTAFYVIAAVILLIYLCVRAFRNRPGAYDYSKKNRNRPGISDYLGKEILDDDAPDEFEYELDML